MIIPYKLGSIFSLKKFIDVVPINLITLLTLDTTHFSFFAILIFDFNKETDDCGL